jgi:hypothetical protein
MRTVAIRGVAFPFGVEGSWLIVGIRLETPSCTKTSRTNRAPTGNRTHQHRLCRCDQESEGTAFRSAQTPSHITHHTSLRGMTDCIASTRRAKVHFRVRAIQHTSDVRNTAETPALTREEKEFSTALLRSACVRCGQAPVARATCGSIAGGVAAAHRARSTMACDVPERSQARVTGRMNAIRRKRVRKPSSR